MKQYTDQWWEARRGKFTASQAWRLLVPEERRAYICEVVADRMGIDPPVQKQSYAGLWGHRYEPIARTLFQQRTGLKVKEVGFQDAVDDELRGWFGASPDGMGDGFGIEIKSLSKSKHRAFAHDGVIDSKYRIQIASQLLVTGVPTWYFVSYHPTEQPDLQYKIILRSEMEELINTIKDALTGAIEEAKNELKEWGGEV